MQAIEAPGMGATPSRSLPRMARILKMDLRLFQSGNLCAEGATLHFTHGASGGRELDRGCRVKRSAHDDRGQGEVVAKGRA